MTDARNEEAEAPRKDKRVYVLRSLEQVRVLADALRVRIIRAYGNQARTTKQLAEILGEKPGKLYHHVDALEKVELVRLEKTRQNRGTLEKYYRPVADTFKTDPDLFTCNEELDEKTAALKELATVTFEGAAEDFLQVISDPEADLESASVLTRMQIRGSVEHIAKVRGQLEQILDLDSANEDGAEADEDAQTFGLLVAFYPLAKSRPGPSEE